ncbi:MAG: M15 family metallopeptidase, partial [Erysipelotrichaceae bacterium]|nr:M15 family metallopeptidase [Erysipelotrichaceae bacterium]
DEVTLYRRVPFHLESLSDEVPGDSSVIVDRAIQQPLLNMCAVIQNDLESEDLCGGLYVETGYVSYESQKALFDEAKRMYGNDAIRNSFEAGHSEHQLGLAIDFKKDEDFVESDAYKWLKKNAYRYGFIESYTSKNEYVTNKEPNPYHWRYVGEDVAQMLMVRDISLKDYTEMKE